MSSEENEISVSVSDIVNFFVRVGDPAKAKKDIAQLSSKDKTTAIKLVASSGASRQFKIDVAKFFVYDLDMRVRKKAELILEELVPGWVCDPAESILKLFTASDHKGASRRNAAVRFLFGIIDAGSLRITLMTLLHTKNRTHKTEIISILEDYIETTEDESEQVKIFDACLDIVLSDDADYGIKHHASNLLSVFFNKVKTTALGETLKRKYVEKQVEKAEGVYRYLCSGSSGLNGPFLEDLLRPLNDGGRVYQLKILIYFSYILECIRDKKDIDTVLDIYPNYWNKDEPPQEEKIGALRIKIVRGVEELWDFCDDPEVRVLIMKIKYHEYSNKKELLEQIRTKLEGEAEGGALSESARLKIALMLRCFLLPSEEAPLKLLAAHLLLFKVGGAENRMAALEYLAYYVESKSLNYAESGSIATVIESLLAAQELTGKERDRARYILFAADPARFTDGAEQKAILNQLRALVEGAGLGSQAASERIFRSLELFADKVSASEKLIKAARYLAFKIKNPTATPTLENLERKG